jgi:hypothetical protein
MALRTSRLFVVTEQTEREINGSRLDTNPQSVATWKRLEQAARSVEPEFRAKTFVKILAQLTDWFPELDWQRAATCGMHLRAPLDICGHCSPRRSRACNLREVRSFCEVTHAKQIY